VRKIKLALSSKMQDKDQEQEFDQGGKAKSQFV